MNICWSPAYKMWVLRCLTGVITAQDVRQPIFNHCNERVSSWVDSFIEECVVRMWMSFRLHSKRNCYVKYRKRPISDSLSKRTTHLISVSFLTAPEVQFAILPQEVTIQAESRNIQSKQATAPFVLYLHGFVWNHYFFQKDKASCIDLLNVHDKKKKVHK